MNFMKRVTDLNLNEKLNSILVTYKSPNNILFTIATAMLVFYVLILFKFAFFSMLRTPLDNYLWTELLINYQGGFIRRGLIGEFLWQTKSLLDFRVIALLFINFCFAVYYFILCRKLIQAYDKYLVLFLLASPVLLFYLPYNFIALYKKDVFIFLTLLLKFHYISQYAQYKLSALKTYSYIITLFIIGTLIHEILIFFTLLPALLLWQEEYKKGRGTLSFIAIGLFIACTALFTYMHFGTKEQAEAIAQSWEAYLHLENGILNNGAIAWIPKRFSDAWVSLCKHFFSISDIVYTSIAFILGALPIALIYSYYNVQISIKKYFTLPSYHFFLLIAILSPLSLFFIMLDHGRVVSFTLIYYLFFLITMQEINPQEKRIEKLPFLKYSLQNNNVCYIGFFFFILYAFTWRVEVMDKVNVIKFSIPMDRLLNYLF